MTSKLHFLFLFYFVISSFFAQAQVTIGSDIPANKGSLLDLKMYAPNSNNSNADKGLLLPRVLLNAATDFNPILPGVSAEDKLLYTALTVYHVGSPNLCSGVHVWSGSRWERLPGACKITTTCESVAVNGVYKVGQVLNETNTITLNIIVPREATGGIYTIYTDVQNGISFSRTGDLTEGTQLVTLSGAGSPLSGGVEMRFTIQADFSNSESSSTICSAKIARDVIPIGRPTIFGFGSASGTYGYFLESSASRAILTSSNNFGTNGTSKVNSDGFNIVTNTLGGLTVPNFVNSPSSGLGLNPDIIVNGFESYTVSSVVINELVQYLERGGVLILFDEYGDTSHAYSISLQLFRALFPNSTISYKHLGGESSVYKMTSTVDDDITNGPFGDVRGTYWGEDASPTSGFLGLPTDSITVYSNGDIMGGSVASGNAPTTNPGYVTMFKHNRLNLFFVGDGGFTSNHLTTIGPTYLTYYQYCPLSIDANYSPIPRTNWGLYGPSGGGKFTVHNSQIFANIMYWAIKNAPSNK